MVNIAQVLADMKELCCVGNEIRYSYMGLHLRLSVRSEIQRDWEHDCLQKYLLPCVFHNEPVWVRVCVHVPSIVFDVFVCVCMCAHHFLLGTAVCSYPRFFNLSTWNKPAQLISAEVSTVRVFLQVVFFFSNEPTWEPNKRRPAWYLPAIKPVQREILNLPPLHPCISPRTSLMSSKTMFIFALCTTASLIGVCVLCLCVCHKKGRRQLSTANNTIYNHVLLTGANIRGLWLIHTRKLCKWMVLYFGKLPYLLSCKIDTTLIPLW